MKSIKMLGLAVTAALMAMALVGAGSAMAESTALCDQDPGTGAHEVCPAGHLVTHVHESTLAGNKARLLSSVVEIKCDVLFLGDALSSLGNPLVIHGSLTYTNCETAAGGKCTVTEVSANAIVNVLKLRHELADVSYLYEIKLSCGVLINCTYNGTGLSAHGLGPLLTSETNGEARLEYQIMTKVKGLCPELAELDILTTPLSPTYITE